MYCSITIPGSKGYNQVGFIFIYIFSATTSPYTQCFSIFNPTVYYTTGHSIVVADILKDLVNLESDVTGIQSPNLGHHATYSLKRKKIVFLSSDGTLLTTIQDLSYSIVGYL